jgi:hypothetical protein
MSSYTFPEFPTSGRAGAAVSCISLSSSEMIKTSRNKVQKQLLGYPILVNPVEQ